MSAPTRRFETPGRDLPQRTGARRVMTETIPIKKQNGFPSGWCPDLYVRKHDGACGMRGGRTAEKGDEPPPFHSITSSARASSVGGMSRPSALAVWRLMTSSYVVGACTGRSAGFSPLRMRST